MLFRSKIYEYGVPHRIIKMTVDYLPAEILNKYLATLSEARVYAEPVYEEMEQYYQHIARDIAAKNNFSGELILAMTRNQFNVFLETGILPAREVLDQQTKNVALYVRRGVEQAFSDQEVVLKIEKLLYGKNEGKQLQGQTAYPGKVKGVVRIVLDPAMENTFKEGEILVTGMTRPEYLSLVQKSAGFITDAGGILSHAAITARELKKPCVIGTETATKMLKNGDLVEIDAGAGIITIIK